MKRLMNQRRIFAGKGGRDKYSEYIFEKHKNVLEHEDLNIFL